MIRRRKPLARNSKPIARSPIKRKPVDPARLAQWKPYIPAKRSKPRRGPLRSPAYRAWIRELGKCPACLVELERAQASGGCGLGKTPYCYRAAFRPGMCDPAHTENGGMGMKGPDSSCSPLCRGFDTPNHHREYDAGRERFQAKYGLDMQAEAAAQWKEFRGLEDG